MLAYWQSMVGKKHNHKTSNGGGWKHSDEVKEKMRQSKLGDKNPVKREGVREKISASKKANPTRYWLGKTRKPVSQETREKLRKAHSGENHYNWKGGITSIKHRLRSSSLWVAWRTSVFERDEFTCRECSAKGVYIEPHHIIPLCESVEGAYDINNGITLCRPCHLKTVRRESNYKERYFLKLTNA